MTPKDFDYDPIQRPGLAYRYAYDWLTTQLKATESAVATLTPTLSHGVELLRRFETLPFLEPTPPGLVHAALRLGLKGVSTFPSHQALGAVAWVEPVRSDLLYLLRLRQWLQPNGLLFVVVGGRLARFLAERRQVKREFLDIGMIQQALDLHGFWLKTHVSLHGTEAIIWHLFGQLSKQLGLHNWYDRCHYGMRRAFVKSGKRTPVAALHCICAVKR